MERSGAKVTSLNINTGWEKLEVKTAGNVLNNKEILPN